MSLSYNMHKHPDEFILIKGENREKPVKPAVPVNKIL